MRNRSDMGLVASGDFPRRLAIGVGLLVAVVLAMVGLALFRSYQDFRDAADVNAGNLSVTLAQSLTGKIGQVDLGLLTAADEIERQLAGGKPDAASLTAFMARLQTRLPWVIGLRATDESGIVRYGVDVPVTGTVNLADRDYFTGLRDDARIGLYINNPVVSRINKVWVVNFARRLRYPDGRFAGVVFANIPLEGLGKMLSVVDVGPRGAINLRNEQMGLIARHPAPQDWSAIIGKKDISPEFREMVEAGHTAGTFFSPTSFDNTARVVSFRRIGNYPLFVSVGLARWDFLEEWRRESAQLGGLALLFIAISAGGLVLLGRVWRRQQDALARLVTEEERFHTVADYTYDWEYWEGEDGAIRYMSPSCERLTGYGAGEFAADPGLLLRIVHPDDRAAMEEHRHDLMHHALAEVDHRIVNRDGETRWVSHCCQAVFGQDGHYLGRRVSNRDITERQRSEDELKRYKDQLEDKVQQRTADLVLARNAAETANKAKSVFLASMSHELRTPLNSILGFSSMMRKDAHLPANLRQDIEIINRSGEHLLALINDVLEMAKIEAGRVQLENAAFDLGSMVRDITDMMELRAREKGLRLLIDQTSRFPRYIVGDEARLRQVLINLVGNAVKFTAQGGITVRLGTKENRVAHLLIEIEDSGCGIAPEDQQRIFEPFVQIGERRGSKGTGLGLTISRQFVEMMGGKITLESAVGKGSLFRIDLPLTAATESDVANAEVASEGDVVGLAPGQPVFRILIVEDQLENQLLLAKLMEAVGFQIKVAENGEEGVAAFLHWHPHFIWMDRQMPVMDGLEATRRIRDLPGGKEVKIVAVTASAFQEQRAEMLAAGMDDFVRKPYRFKEIYDCLAQQIGVRYLRAPLPDQDLPPAVLTPEMLSVLPEELRGSLKAALESLETEHIAAAIGQTGRYDPNLEKVLRRFVGVFDYPSILKLLEQLPSGAS